MSSPRTAYSNENPHAFLAEIKVSAQSFGRHFAKVVASLPEYNAEEQDTYLKALGPVFLQVYKKTPAANPMALAARIFRVVSRLQEQPGYLHSLLEHIGKPRETTVGPHVQVTWTIPSLHGGQHVVSGHIISNVDKRFQMFGKSWFVGESQGAPDIRTDPGLLFAFLVDVGLKETMPVPPSVKERALKQYSEQELAKMKRLAFDEWDPKAFLTALNKHTDELLGKFMHASHAAYAAFEARQRQRTQQYGQKSVEVFESYSTFFPLFKEILIPFFAKHGVTGPAADNAVISFAKNAERNPVDFVVYMGHIKHPKTTKMPPPQDGLAVAWTLGAHTVTGTIMTDHSHSWYLSPRGTVATDPSNLLVALLMARTPSPSAKALSLPSSRFPSR